MVPSRNSSSAISLAASCDMLPGSNLAADTRSAGNSTFTVVIRSRYRNPFSRAMPPMATKGLGVRARTVRVLQFQLSGRSFEAVVKAGPKATESTGSDAVGKSRERFGGPEGPFAQTPAFGLKPKRASAKFIHTSCLFNILQMGGAVHWSADRIMSTYTNPFTDYSPQMEFQGGPSETYFSNEPRAGVLSDSAEMELAAEFLDVEDEAELEQFLGGLIDHIGSSLGKIVKSPLGQAVGGVLKKVAKEALPIAGGALGGVVGGPVGAMIGSNLASMAGSALGLELEGLSPEDREFEASRRFVRFACQTIANALHGAPYDDPEAVAYSAAVEAARAHAPGLMNIAGIGRREPKRRTGRWIRHRGRIILLGV
jgi:hypothetical protein